MMRSWLVVLVAAFAVVADAGVWEGLADENHVSGSKLTERDLLGKVVLVCHFDGSAACEQQCARIEQLWKGHDHKRFMSVGSVAGMEKSAAAAAVAGMKLTFPVYRDLKLASDRERRPAGSLLLVGPYGKVIAAANASAGKNPGFEELLVNAITEAGLPPTLVSGVVLDKYKSLKNALKLGTDLKGTVRQLEKDVAAAGRKSATAAQREKAAEAAGILTAIKNGKTELGENIAALSDLDPAEAYRLLSLYVKSFPEEAAGNKAKLAELKSKLAEFMKRK